MRIEKAEKEMARIKAYFPYRIVFCIGDGEEFEVFAAVTKHRINKALREGKKVYEYR